MSGRGYPRRGVTTFLRALAGGAGALALAGASDTERDESGPCPATDVEVRVYQGSRLFDGRGERLELVRGRGLDCDDARVRRMLAPLGDALLDFPRERLRRPLEIHLDPRLPARQAPLAGIEVHVTSREVLMTSAAMGAIGPEVWRHELLHTLAATPPETPAEARRLWLTLEEGVVGYLTITTGARRERGVPAPNPPLVPASEPMASVVPLLEWLGSPAYDPHPLAAGLARELDRIAPDAPLDPWLDCISAEPAAEHVEGRRAATSRPFAAPLPAALAAVFRAFVGRCPTDVQSTLSTAVAGWWGEPLTGRPLGDRPPIDGRQRGKPAAPGTESR
jgi:hypothetical protein